MLFLLLKTTALQCTENQLFLYTIIMWTSWIGTRFFLVEISERKLLEWPISWTHFEFFQVGANQKCPLKNTDLQKVAYKHNFVSSTLSYERDSNSRLYFWGTDFMIWNFCHQICFDGNNYYTIYWLLMR
jgi:hypothetical protein